MKVLIGGVVIIALLGASSAGAWPWSNKGKHREKLPRPIDYPIVRPKADDSHKHRIARMHPAQYQRAEWGSEMGRFTHAQPKTLGVPYLFQE